MNSLHITWDPSLGIDLGFFTLRYYSLMFVLAFGFGLTLMKKIFIHEEIPLEKLDKLFIYTVLATILGARLGHVFFYDWTYYKEHLEEVLLPFRFQPYFQFTGFAGLASHGAAVGIITALYFYSKNILHKPLLYILDRLGIVVALAGFFIRIGNLMNSEIVGKPTRSNFGFVFKKLGEDFPRHPTQLYESFSYLILFFILWRLFWKTNKKEQLGYLFGIFFTSLWSLRFFLEFLKEAQIDERNDWYLNTGQWLSIPLILVGLFFVLRKQRTTK
jgi:phosphatidylglycerol:prolipoprotein diacylglycerol transferase